MRIAIANDEPRTSEALKNALNGISGYHVTWIAHDGAEAVRRCSEDTPDLILMDLSMPFIDGVSATRQIMSKAACAVLILTAFGDEGSSKVVDALAAGAVDAIAIPGGRELQASTGGLGNMIQKIRAIEATLNGGPASADAANVNDLVLVGASAGGPAAFAEIIGRLPADFRAAVVLAQHVDSVFVPTLVSWLARQTTLPIHMAEEGERLKPGTIFIADTAKHLIFRDRQHLGYTKHPEESPYRPCIDVFFESAAAFRYNQLVGMILTGMGRDGARGLEALRAAGAITIAQDAVSCVVYGMPKAAVERGAAKEILPLDAIAPRLISIFSRK